MVTAKPNDGDLRAVRRRLRARLDIERRVARLAKRLKVPSEALAVRGWRHTMAVGHETVEFVRSGGKLSHPYRPQHAFLALPGILPQEPVEHRVYWSDPGAAALIGLVMGLDLIRNDGRYYLVEVNTNAALNPERRQLYGTEIDPLVTALVETVKRQGFRRLVLLRQKGWTDAYHAEFGRASAMHGVAVMGMAMQGSTPGCQPELPLPLEPDTAYHVFSNWNPPAPALSFLHDKWSFAQWTRRLLDRDADQYNKLAYMPTYREPVILAGGGDPRYPNVVLKLAASDKGQHVKMGRFRDAAEALRGFGIRQDDPQASPAVFRQSLRQRLAARLRDGTGGNVFQPFVAPDTAAGRPRVIRLNVFVSPRYDVFLSAYAKVAPAPLPHRHPEGLTQDDRPYVVNFARGAEYRKLEPEVEAEMVEVAAEFGELLRTAMCERFDVGSNPLRGTPSVTIVPRGLV